MANYAMPLDVDIRNFNFSEQRKTTAEAARYLGVSEQFLRSNVVTRRHPIPVVRVGTKVFYLKCDLDTYLLQHRSDDGSAK